MMRTLSVAGLAIGLLTGAAAAQQSDSTKSNLTPAPAPAPAPQPQIITPAPSKPLSGVQAKFPDPKIIQGVRAALPGPHDYSNGPIILPNPSPYWTPPGGAVWGPPGGAVWSPAPAVTPAFASPDNTHDRLVQRYIDSLRNNGIRTNVPPVINQPGDTYSPDRLNNNRPGVVPSRFATPVLDTATGLIRGRYLGDKWRLQFVLNNSYPSIQYRTDTSYFKYPVGLYRSWYAPWEDANRYVDNRCGVNPYLVADGSQPYVVDPRLYPQSAPQEPVRELTPLEKAEYALHTGDADEAVKQFKVHLKESPEDAGVERLMAMALIDDRKVDQAVAVIMHAYTKQPALARDPIDPSMLSGGELDHRRRFQLIMDYATRTRTASGLFAAAIMAQSEGRLDTAKKLLDRAVATGIDKKVAEEMKIAIANR